MNDDQFLQSLVTRIAAGDEKAFKALFDRYYPSLLNYAMFILELKFASEEIVSGVFINIWENREGLKKIRNLKSYLYVSVKNHSYNYIRDNRKVMISKPDHKCFTMIRTFRNPESIYLEEELREQIEKSIESLPQRCKMIFRMIREDQLKYQEVADLLDISVKTVEVQMGRAMTKLKQALKPLKQEYHPHLHISSKTA